MTRIPSFYNYSRISKSNTWHKPNAFSEGNSSENQVCFSGCGMFLSKKQSRAQPLEIASKSLPWAMLGRHPWVLARAHSQSFHPLRTSFLASPTHGTCGTWFVGVFFGLQHFGENCEFAYRLWKSKLEIWRKGRKRTESQELLCLAFSSLFVFAPGPKIRCLHWDPLMAWQWQTSLGSDLSGSICT